MRQEVNKDKNLLLTSSRYMNQREYWAKKLSGDPGRTVLLGPVDKHRRPGKLVEKAEIRFSPDLFRSLMKLSKNTPLAIYLILLAGLKSLIYHYTGRNDIFVISPLYKMNVSEGTYNDHLYIRRQNTGKSTFKELLIELRQSVFDAYENQDYPFDDLVESLYNSGQLPSKGSYSNVECVLRNIHHWEKRDYEDIGDTLVFSFLLEETGVRGFILYNPDVYRSYYPGQAARHFTNILERGIADINGKISDISFLSPEEKDRLLFDFNKTAMEYPKDKLIHERFEEQCARTPEGIAAVYRDRQVSYGHLDKKSRQVARLLQKKGVKPDTIIGIMVEPSIEMLVGIWGILRAGGAYLPIAPDLPGNRVEFMLEDSRAEFLVTTRALAPKKTQTHEGIYLDDEPAPAGRDVPAGNTVTPSDLAYIIYTSGTTGAPKGVLIRHRNLLAYIEAFYNEFDISPGDTVIQQASFTFDAFVEELYPVLLRGGRLFVPDKDEIVDFDILSGLLLKHRVNLISCSPLLLSELNRLDGKNAIHTYISGGDVLKPRHIDNLLKNGNVYNTYGPTETTVCITYYRCPRTPGATIPIGKPVSNYRVYILGKDGKLPPAGVPGELCAAGEGTARGYLNRPELTREKFTPHPFLKGEGIYRTGDLARWMPDGNIEFLGRLDGQLKIRGYRIELGEIEKTLLTHKEIKEAVVVAFGEDPSEERYICAYFISDREFEISELRGHLSRDLPDYMIPSYFMQVESIPLNAGGKPDTKALPVPRIAAGKDYEAPRDEIERTLVLIWSEVLVIKSDSPDAPSPIGINSNFFHLGGHSLNATILAAKIHKAFDVKLQLVQVFKTPTVKGLARFMRTARAKDRYAAIEPVEEKEYYPLSPAQKRMYVLQQMESGNITYNLPGVFQLEGELHRDRLENAFAALVRRHESFRTSFPILDGEPVQRIHRETDFEIESCNMIEGFTRFFDLSKAPLLRVGLIPGGPGKPHILMVDMHHIVTDGVSMDVFINELAALYAGKGPPPLRLQYRDYSEWQNSEEREKDIRGQGQYWLRQFEGDIPVLNLPVDYPRPAVQRFEGAVSYYELPAAQVRGLKGFVPETGATFYMVLLAVYNILLSRLGGGEDIVVGTPVAARRHTDLQRIVGMFVNTLAMRNYPEGGKTFREFLEELKQRTLRAFENQDYQFEDLVEQVVVTRDTGRNPLFDTMLSLPTTAEQTPGIPGIQGTEIPGFKITPYDNIKKTAKFDLHFNCLEEGDKMLLAVEYRTGLFKPETVDRFVDYFKRIVSAVVESPDGIISEIEMISGDEKRQLLHDFNDTGAGFPGDKPVHLFFEEKAEKHPDRSAVVVAGAGEGGAVTLSYRELNERSGRLAAVLTAKGVNADTVAGIIAERSMEMMVGIFAVLKAGGAYLPMDPAYPDERIRYILKNSSARLLLTVGDFDAGGICETMDMRDAGLYNGEKREPAVPGGTANLAYVIYTSGSTGRPKGVAVEHRALTNRLHWMQKQYPLGEDDTLVQKTPFTFDVSVWEIAWWAMAGARVVLLPPGGEKVPGTIADTIQRRRVTVIHFVPSMLNTFLEYVADTSAVTKLSPLKQVICSGEVLTGYLVKRFNRLLSGANSTRLANLYGPTEAAIDVSYFDCPAEGDIETVPIGRPIDNIKLYIKSKDHRPQPPGVSGELCIAGAGLARGYLNNPALTRERFVPNPFAPGTRMYLTGDIAHWLPDGNIEFSGRIDHQVKIRGFRIELGEIEHRLLNLENIKEAAVTANQDKSGDKYLCAYIAADKEFDTAELKERLARELPGYMVPAHFVQLERLPLTPNGKINRKALPEPEIVKGKEYTAPRDHVEDTLAVIWSGVLGIDKALIGIDSRFFDLGGHSLRGTVMTAGVHKALDVNVPLTEVFKTPTIRGLAEYIKNAAKEKFSGVDAVEKKEYYALSSAQKRLYITQQMDPGAAAYNMPGIIPLAGAGQTGGRGDHREKLEETLLKLIHRHESLRTSFLTVNGEPVQKVHDAGDTAAAIEYYDRSGEVKTIMRDFVRPFDLAAAPLLRVGLIETGDADDLLLIDMHHIISDAVSLEILTGDFIALYRGRGDRLPELRIHYKDYSEWQNQRNESRDGTLKHQEKYWLNRFKGTVPTLKIPSDSPRDLHASKIGAAGETVEFEAGAELTGKIKTFVSETGGTLFTHLFAAYTVLLSKYTLKEDVVVGTPAAGRRHADLQGIIGMFVNMLPIRTFPVSHKTFGEFYLEVKKDILDASENQDYQFDQLVTKLGLKRESNRNPLVETVFAYDFAGADSQLGALTAGDNPGDRRKQDFGFEKTESIFDLILGAVERNNGIFFYFEYRSGLFGSEKIRGMSRHYKNILKEVADNPDIRLSDIRMLDGEQRPAGKTTENETTEGEFDF